jgi:hypothetical protein
MRAIATVILLDLLEEAVTRKHEDLLFGRELLEEFFDLRFLLLRSRALGDGHPESSMEATGSIQPFDLRR